MPYYSNKYMKTINEDKYPKISIITCVYNGEKYISKLLDSVLDMGYPNIEHIIVNDGSTDSTEAIVMHYSKLYKDKTESNLYIKYIKQENMGLGGATNTGLKEITGEYWTWINCDDWYEKEAFNKTVWFLQNHKRVDYLFLNGGWVREKDGLKGYLTDDKIFKSIKTSMVFYKFFLFNDVHFQYPLFICRTQSFSKINNFAIPAIRYTQDIQLFLIMLPNLKTRKIFNDVLYWRLFRQNSQLLSYDKKKATDEIRSIFTTFSDYLVLGEKDIFYQKEIIRYKDIVVESSKLLNNKANKKEFNSLFYKAVKVYFKLPLKYKRAIFFTSLLKQFLIMNTPLYNLFIKKNG